MIGPSQINQMKAETTLDFTIIRVIFNNYEE